MNHERSRGLYDRALSVMPGGVNSSVRATMPHPFFVERGDGGHVIDADGNRYVDWVMGYGPLLYGHDLPDPVEAAIQSHAAEGPMYGAPTEIEVEHAEFVARHVPSVESIRFVNSGTEATVSAVRLARGHTGRDKIVVMQGGYHGAQESTLVDGSPENPHPSTAGIPKEFAQHTLPIPFNDPAAAKEVFAEHGDEIAAVLVEPILANMGIVMPVDGYHETLRDLCDDHGALLVFDEVITGFRVGGLGCAQSKFGVTPDVTTFGKIIGGGFPVGAIGGQAEIIEGFTPAGDVFQSGTFSGHPVTMAAGKPGWSTPPKTTCTNTSTGWVGSCARGLPKFVRSGPPSTPSSAPTRCSKRSSLGTRPPTSTTAVRPAVCKTPTAVDTTPARRRAPTSRAPRRTAGSGCSGRR